MTRVQIPPYYDLWMRGDKYGDLVKVTVSKKLRDRWGDPVEIAHVKMDITGKIARVIYSDCTEVA